MVTLTQLLPAAPQRGDGRADFSDDADVFASALPIYQAQQNQQALEVQALAERAEAAAVAAVNAPGTTATSATSITVGTGQRTAAVQPGKFFRPGMFLTLACAVAPSNWMVGWVVNYNDETGLLIVNAAVFNGAGTYQDWMISLSAPLAFEPATTAQIFAGASNVVGITPAALHAAVAPVAIPFAASMTFNGLTFINADVGDLTANFSLPSPINMAPGTSGRIRFRQDRVGGRTGSFGAAWDFAAGLVPIFSTPPGAVDELHYFVNSATSISASLRKGVA